MLELNRKRNRENIVRLTDLLQTGCQQLPQIEPAMHWRCKTREMTRFWSPFSTISWCVGHFNQSKGEMVDTLFLTFSITPDSQPNSFQCSTTYF
ncbi:2,3-bisphosphoglycerate-independent phosphoglycerate mutase [Frankliniella fusca]|uniref:2,3-bisphosphoglycerate-independent phosphoglycerate mutase n=1 Tax=Frankliniella fusca TaxID=407009 RepID=A0AAE1HJ73_9NEOP|nr:2,3-bisphosphoglycerate-independent phosphoglycerate mutase [Frankliniella fusca]